MKTTTPGHERTATNSHHGQRVSPYFDALVRQPWQLFVTLTFRETVPSERKRIALFFALLRRLARRTHAHFPSLGWYLREENGGRFGRTHFHFMLTGLPTNRLGAAVCRWLVAEWQRLAGGTADARLYDPTRPGVRYTLKICSTDAASMDGRESAKFGPNDCRLWLSTQLERTLGITR